MPPVKVHCPNPQCQASFSVAPGEAARFRRCPQCGTELEGLGDTDSKPTRDGSAGAEWSPPPSAWGIAVGTTFAGRYTIVRELGRGGMGAVYLARDIKLDRLVALKVPLVALDDTEFRRRFRREATSAAKLHHPNICPVHDVGEHDGQPYLTMAYIEGRSLSDTLKQRNAPRDPIQAAKLVRTVARALQKAHDAGIIHRDLKPGNIVMTPEGRPVVMDFGLARRDDPTDSLQTRSGQMLGTPAYMPLEQFRGDLRVIGPASDVYSLGVILFQLLTGRLPFSGHAGLIFEQLLTTGPPSASTFLPGLDPALEAICRKAMAREVGDRFASMTEFATALDGVLAAAPRPASSHVAPAVSAQPQRVAPTPGAESRLVGDSPVTPKPSSTLGPTARVRSGWRTWVGAAALGSVAFLVVVAYVVTHNPTPDVTPNSEPSQTEDNPSTIASAPSPSQPTVTTAPAPPSPPPAVRTNSVGMTLKLIPAGMFLMGDDSSDQPDEKPRHPVRITKPFYLAAHEVTQEQYAQVVGGEPPSHFKDQPKNPVESVSWFDAINFCNRLSAKEDLAPYYTVSGTDVTIRGGDGYRLPTEAEWEYACRAGGTGAYGFDGDESKLGQYAWFGEGDGKTHPVGQKRPNDFRLYDMHGNVWEWCWDWYDEKYYQNMLIIDPVGPKTGTHRVLRWGSFLNTATLLRAADRNWNEPALRLRIDGFRPARTYD